MKIRQYLLVGGLMLATLSSFAQKDSLFNAPQKGDFMFEVNFDPFGDDGVISFESFQTKYWLNNKTAFRLGLQFDHKSNSINESDYSDDEEMKVTGEEKYTLIGFRPGIEFRLLQHSKISPYWGFEFNYVKKSTSSEYTDYSKQYEYNGYDDEETLHKTTTEIEGAWRKVTEHSEYRELPYPYSGHSYFYSQETDYEKERAFTTFGMNLILGADVFLYKNLYMGVEVGLGYCMTNYDKINVDVTESEVESSGAEKEEKVYPSKKESSFKFYSNNAIRLGFCF